MRAVLPILLFASFALAEDDDPKEADLMQAELELDTQETDLLLREQAIIDRRRKALEKDHELVEAKVAVAKEDGIPVPDDTFADFMGAATNLIQSWETLKKVMDETSEKVKAEDADMMKTFGEAMESTQANKQAMDNAAWKMYHLLEASDHPKSDGAETRAVEAPLPPAAEEADAKVEAVVVEGSEHDDMPQEVPKVRRMRKRGEEDDCYLCAYMKRSTQNTFCPSYPYTYDPAPYDPNLDRETDFVPDSRVADPMCFYCCWVNAVEHNFCEKNPTLAQVPINCQSVQPASVRITVNR